MAIALCGAAIACGILLRCAVSFAHVVSHQSVFRCADTPQAAVRFRDDCPVLTHRLASSQAGESEGHLRRCFEEAAKQQVPQTPFFLKPPFRKPPLLRQHTVRIRVRGSGFGVQGSGFRGAEMGLLAYLLCAFAARDHLDRRGGRDRSEARQGQRRGGKAHRLPGLSPKQSTKRNTRWHTDTLTLDPAPLIRWDACSGGCSSTMVG